MRLIQFIDREGQRRVAASIDNESHRLVQASTTRELALAAHRLGLGLQDHVLSLGLGEKVNYKEIIDDRRILVPLDHPDPAHCLLAITGLTHLGSASFRDALHAKLASSELSDSMKLFKSGLEGGKPPKGSFGVQPEWAYKGDGSWIVAPESPIESPEFAEDGGEEAEIAGLYVIADDGTVLRVGFALANEFSDHVMEGQNYLYLAHSKLRPSSFGPELYVGELPENVVGTVSIKRGEQVIWQSEFISGEANMSHTIANLEYHHFKYEQFRRPGDVHVYYYGASNTSFATGFKAEWGDTFEIESSLFGAALRNKLVGARGREVPHSVKPL